METFMSARRTFLKKAGSIALAGAALALGIQTHAHADAQAWPKQTLKIIVPNAAGGTSDIIARMISKPLSDALGQPVIVDNRPGANGNIGAALVAQASDAHTILLCDVGALSISPLIYKKMPYDPLRDLKGVAMLAYSPHLLVVNPQVQANNLRELAALSKRTPLNVALPGTGTPNHLATVQIAMAAGVQWQHVPYKGGAQALTDTMAGTTQAVLNGMVATLPMVKTHKLKVIGVSKRTRIPALPQVPTIAEQGIPNFESGTWQGITVSSNMPDAAVTRLYTELARIMPALQTQLAEVGGDVTVMSPAETTAFIAKENRRWADVIRQAGAEIEGPQ
jgi:tripartite-type tricarboxylate transporter receptor subunit TctC